MGSDGDESPEVKALRADNKRLLETWVTLSKENERLRAALDGMVEACQEFKDENERLKRYERDFPKTVQHCGPRCACVREQREALADAEAKVERLRAALTEMLESFTEPEDDNDILRRARVALE